MGYSPVRFRKANKGPPPLFLHIQNHTPPTNLTTTDSLRRSSNLQPRPQRRKSKLSPPLHPHIRVYVPEGREQVGPRLRPPLDARPAHHTGPGLHAARLHHILDGGAVSSNVPCLVDLEHHVDCYGLCHICAAIAFCDTAEAEKEAKDRHRPNVLPRFFVRTPEAYRLGTQP